MNNNFDFNFDFKIKNKKRALLFLAIGVILLAAIAYYVFLPAINVGSIEMWVFIIFVFLVFGVVQLSIGFKDKKIKLGTISIGIGLLRS